MEAARQYSVSEAETHLSRVLKQAATGEEAVIRTILTRDKWIPSYDVQVMSV
ncbi:hypothetical protein [Streptomyces sp. NPDC091416]|uniref:hypothetical protein n=1 Tax=Streptomyces sp. NPDC091416 TaxID=3366003 RepID=UPI00380E25E9